MVRYSNTVGFWNLRPMPARAISGSLMVSRSSWCPKRARAGMGFVPQGREIFSRLTVEENLRMGLAYKSAGTPIPAELFLSLAGSHSLVVVEHDMTFIEKIARKVTVLHEGSVLAEGTMDQVQNDQDVIDVYLGA